MSKYNAQSIYGTLFSMLDELSDNDAGYLMENIFDDEFLKNIKESPKKAYDVLDTIVKNIENGSNDKIAVLLKNYKDKIYMLKAMLKDYGEFSERHIRLTNTIKKLKEKRGNANGL